jgi:Spy/CpxP family protein refolding chaperone
MKWTMGGAALLAAMVALAPLQADTQMGPRGQRGMMPGRGGQPGVMPGAGGQQGQQGMMAGPRGAGIEMILRQRERLELSEDQVKQLDQIRQEAVARQTAHRAEMAELASKVRAGQMEASALREQMQARRDAATEIQAQQRERVEALLNDAQKEKLQEWGATARAFRMGRASAIRGRQGRGQWARGAGQAFPGRAPLAGFRGGFAPGMRHRFAPGPHGMRGFRRGMGMGPGFGPPRDTIPG